MYVYRRKQGCILGWGISALREIEAFLQGICLRGNYRDVIVSGWKSVWCVGNRNLEIEMLSNLE